MTPGCLGYIGDENTQVCGTINRNKDPYKTARIQRDVRKVFFVAQLKIPAHLPQVHPGRCFFRRHANM